MDLKEISNRANINHREVRGNTVILYEDHRTLLNVLCKYANICNTNFRSINIMLFDKHDDFLDLSENALKALESIRHTPDNKFNERMINEFVEFDLSPIDDNWVKAGMELGYINNVFLFNAEVTKIDFHETYTTKSGEKKSIYNVGAIWDALEGHGILNDLFRKDELSNFWCDFGWKISEGRFNLDTINRPFIVDIDLDVFSVDILNTVTSIPFEILINKMDKSISNSNHKYNSSLALIKHLLSESQFTSICFETSHCGGFKQSHEIFNFVNYFFFENQII